MAEDAELIRRREIRRKKILENSEARMNKITGRQYLSGHESSCISEHSSHRLYGGSPDIKLPEDGPTVKNPNKQIDLKSTTPIQTDFFTGLPLSDLDSNGVHHRGDVLDSNTFPKKVSDAETRSFGRTRADSRRNSSCKQLMMETLQFSSLRCNILRPWIAMTVGMCLKLFFILPYSFLFSRNLLFPFVLLELTLYIWMKLETQGAPRSAPQSLFLGALMLCGVSTNFISSLNEILITMQYLIEDFAMYLFSFVVSHFIYENYIV